MIRTRQITPAQDVTVNKTGASCTSHAKPTGGGNAQSSSTPSAYDSEALRLLWREVRSRPALFLGIAPLFEEVRRSLRDQARKRPQMASPVSSRLGLTASRLKEAAPHRDLARRSLPINFLCRLLLWSFLCCAWATSVQAQESGQGQAAAHHHPPQDQQLHEKFYSTWRMPDHPWIGCCNNADCYPTEIKYVDGSIYARRREDGKYILIPPEKVEQNRDNPDGRNHLCAPPPRRFDSHDTVFCFALGGAT
jgi:hypothetical protein